MAVVFTSPIDCALSSRPIAAVLIGALLLCCMPAALSQDQLHWDAARLAVGMGSGEVLEGVRR